MAQKVLNGISEVPWKISLDVGHIKGLVLNHEVLVVHTFREGNSLTIFFTNYVFDFAGTHKRQFFNMQEIPLQAQAIIKLDKDNVPNLRI